MTVAFRVGSRRSPLALAQTGLVVRSLRRAAPESEFVIVPITTAGDRNRSVGSSPDFTDRISAAVESGEVDLAVHSAKDLPTRPERDVRVAAFPRRGDPSDALVGRRDLDLIAIPDGTRIGSSSVRRRAQLLREWPRVTVVEVRGNVGTRLDMVDRGSVDAVVLAVAGLRRLGSADRIGRRLSIRRFVPAPGQGALAVEIRPRDRTLDRIVRAIDHPPTRAAVTAERSCAAAFGADCNFPLGVLGRVRGEVLSLHAELLEPGGRRSVRVERAAGVGTAASLGRLVAAEIVRATESPWPRSGP
ncbi:MAG: hydroxymethylbilane synthase [Thermoplasmata archaeon]|nr:hydroxymethylbilane synthase [Thermoplasmata archaeon]